MLRYVIVDSVRYVLHAFVMENALVENPETGVVKLVAAEGIQFDPPTVLFMRQQLEAQQRAAAAQGRSGIIHG